MRYTQLVEFQKYILFTAVIAISLMVSMNSFAQQEANDSNFKSQALKEINTKLKINLRKLETIKTEIKAQIDNHSKVTKNNIDHIALIYANMDPKKTAQIISNGNLSLAAELLKKIPPAKASAILNEIEPEIAKKITAKIIQPLNLEQVKCKELEFIFPEVECRA